jgi:hypothetical protein
MHDECPVRRFMQTVRDVFSLDEPVGALRAVGDPFKRGVFVFVG